jgi:hypothetical protein
MPINEPQRVNVLPGDGININTYPDGKQGIGEFDRGEYLEFDFNITNAGIYKVGTYLSALEDGVGYILTVDGTEAVEILVNGYPTGTGAPEGASGFDHFNYLKPFETLMIQLY